MGNIKTAFASPDVQEGQTEGILPYHDLGGAGEPLHFAHANGYPPLAYRPLLERLARDYHVLAMRMRPLWRHASPRQLRDWRPLAEDLQTFLDQLQLHQLIGIGHSMGGTTTLRLALRQPERFSALVLIDPVIFPPRMTWTWKLIYYLGLGYRYHPLVRSALKRRRVFESHAAMFASYRHKPIFSRMDDAGLRTFVEAAAHALPDGRVELEYPPEWEARIYVTGLLADMDIWRALASLKPPLLILRGAETDTFWEETAHLVKQRLPQATVVTIPEASHLLPLEKPEQVYRAITDFLTGHNLRNRKPVPSEVGL